MTTRLATFVESSRSEEVIARLRAQLQGKEADLAAAFSYELFRRAAAEDLEERQLVDLYGAALGVWRFARERKSPAPKVRVFNPVFEEHGWQSTHTIVEIVNDDMPFLVDSVSMAINRHGLTIHLIIHPIMSVLRDDDGELVLCSRPDGADPELQLESIMHIEVDRRTDPAMLEDLRRELVDVLDDVRLAVDDWQPMRARLQDVLLEITTTPLPVPREEVEEIADFLRWIDADHFVFLGYREYDLVTRDEGGDALAAVPASALGILRNNEDGGDKRVSILAGKVKELAREKNLIILTKANSRSTVHRPIHLDYIGIKRFGPDGGVVGEHRFLGLYTERAYHSHPTRIPIVRRRVERVAELAGMFPPSHSGKALLHILETLPRDELFQAGEEELFDLAIGVLRLEERQRVRLLVREDRYHRYFACLVFVPRERYDTRMRERIQDILLEGLGGTDLEFTLQLDESVLARVYFVVRVPGGRLPACDVAALEAKIAEATHDWGHDLAEALDGQYGEEIGMQLWRHYAAGFPPGYRDDFHPRIAVGDIEHMEELEGPDDLGMIVYRRPEESSSRLRLKLLRSSQPLMLHRALPVLENMGLRVLGEHPYRVVRSDGAVIYIHDFDTEHTGPHDLELTAIEEIFHQALQAVWLGDLENDGFNRLVVGANLEARQVSLIRACCKYLLQARIPFSQSYMEQTLAAHPEIARRLVELFETRFDPAGDEVVRDDQAGRLSAAIRAALEKVPNLDEDRIVRAFLAVIEAILRTNYFQRDNEGAPKSYLSFKLDPRSLPYLPEPRPRFEIWVYSPRVEGVHLRAGRVARGGLRWSDRREDFRTEVLGLMKAQTVKNAVIVPTGAKGGFVVKRPPEGGNAAALRAEAEGCYRTFVRGLLDVTDNIVGDEVIQPPDVVCYDEDDPYLVVAADKGTATFSDLANAVAAEYGFWLGDGFASGGSEGYDHKKIGITARGAWESVTRHFHELGRDIQAEDFTVAGIGDMSGDVFGNGLLLSPHIRLVAAFNHRHVFLDPSPDAATSLAERRRLFELGTGSWDRYDSALLSSGGGIYPRSAKSIEISPEVKEALQISDDHLTPAELISCILRAPVDLLWNGGIGTFVKSHRESHGDADDRSNDALRVDARDLRCRVVGEGGNLGFTQAARIEYAMAGGRINTDFLDNSGGVDCSDHEVNLKILLNGLVAAGDLTLKHRNQRLEEMTEEVAKLVLRDNYQQALAVSIAEAHATGSFESHTRMIRTLELSGRLDRALEGLPTDEDIADRKAEERGLTRPELAVLLAYAKIDLKEGLLSSEVLTDPYFRESLVRYFPAAIAEDFGDAVRGHRLHRQIIATSVTNSLVNRAGPSFAYRLAEMTGARLPDIVRAYVAAREVFDLRSYWTAVEALDGVVSPRTQVELFYESVRLVERATRWFVRHCSGELQVGRCVEEFGPGAARVSDLLDTLLQPAECARTRERSGELEQLEVPPEIARRAARFEASYAALDIVDAARGLDADLARVAEIYFRAGDAVGLDWLRTTLGQVPTETYWSRLASATAGDEIHRVQRAVAVSVVREDGEGDPAAVLQRWMERHRGPVDRLRQVLAELRGVSTYDWAMMGVALREARRLADPV